MNAAIDRTMSECSSPTEHVDGKCPVISLDFKFNWVVSLGSNTFILSVAPKFDSSLVSLD